MIGARLSSIKAGRNDRHGRLEALRVDSTHCRYRRSKPLRWYRGQENASHASPLRVGVRLRPPSEADDLRKFPFAQPPSTLSYSAAAAHIPSGLRSFPSKLEKEPPTARTLSAIGYHITASRRRAWPRGTSAPAGGRKARRKAGVLPVALN
jgi:hypothetical protein